MQKPIDLLKHLQGLTGSFDHNGKKIFYINIYSKKQNSRYLPIIAKNEGVACADDSARAVVLALEIYKLFGEKKALQQAIKWLTFLEYMQDKKGFITNFIKSPEGQREYGIDSSHQGGAWWSSRAKWAWAKAYKVIKDKKYLDHYFKTKITERYQNDVASILLLAGLEVFESEDKNRLCNLLKKISSCRAKEGFFLHAKGAPLHLRAYHELEAVAKASDMLGNKKELVDSCRQTVKSLVNDVVNNGFYTEYITRDKSEINPYCVSPLVRGLYELSIADIENKEIYQKLSQKCFDWFEKMYEPTTGACLDWTHGDNISAGYGAEASIEAGFSYVRKLLLSNNTKTIRI